MLYHRKIAEFIETNKFVLLVFFSSLFIFISFAGTRLFFSDEGVILNQFYNLIHGSLALKISKINTAKGGFLLVGNNLYGPIYFAKWGELISIEFTNILISALLVLIIFLLFKELFGNRIGIFATFFVILATPISFYAVTLKHHQCLYIL